MNSRFGQMISRAEVDQIADLFLADPQIVEQLGFVICSQSLDGFQFNDDLTDLGR